MNATAQAQLKRADRLLHNLRYGPVYPVVVAFRCSARRWLAKYRNPDKPYEYLMVEGRDGFAKFLRKEDALEAAWRDYEASKQPPSKEEQILDEYEKIMRSIENESKSNHQGLDRGTSAGGDPFYDLS
jgi:hypothetical protein